MENYTSTEPVATLATQLVLKVMVIFLNISTALVVCYSKLVK